MSEVATEPEQADILVVVFTYSGSCHVDIMQYVAGLYGSMIANNRHPRMGSLSVSYSAGYPTDRCRNAALEAAKRRGARFLLMLDDDMKPDLLLGQDPDAKPFLPTAFDFAINQPEPVCVGAPYCAGPPNQEVVVMRNRVVVPDMPGDIGTKLDKYSREEAAVAKGFEEVAALPTGCLLIDMRCLERMEPPYFQYEYADESQTKLASTEDIFFTRNAAWLGYKQYVLWDAWAGHHKRYLVGKPQLTTVGSVPKMIFKAFQNGYVPELN